MSSAVVERGSSKESRSGQKVFSSVKIRPAVVLHHGKGDKKADTVLLLAISHWSSTRGLVGNTSFVTQPIRFSQSYAGSVEKI